MKIVLLALVLFGLSDITLAAPNEDILSVYLIRHAEKQQGKDPELTKKGLQRAGFYRHFLKDAAIDGIFSTDYQRTQQTVKPLAQHYKKDVTLYDPRQLKQFAEQLKQKKGNYVVVGHSNTTPQLASFLGADEWAMDHHEFDRVYHLILKDGKLIFSTILRSPK
ncbi:histidine phosphatase family protein [Pleionea sp. CnH1-48]|uniref:SixA phosphatase family protein n=1 Tax=Pleionea sp. CnH1-48 TaxID=2954494 RepID=UPI0020971230|nr:phosphoglycerate mutase family protein [Pleionea sp. CnH1-48]MCO7223543.1 histidine phosphatase family protein [Pleionea sp. CnH1-48]